MVCVDVLTWEVVSFENRDARADDRIVFPVDGTAIRTYTTKNVQEGSYISLIEIMLSTFVIPNQWRTSGMRAWNLISLTPAISSVDLKYLSAESPPRFLKLYTRYLSRKADPPFVQKMWKMRER